MKANDQQKILETMIEFAHDGFLVLDSGGVIIDVNPAARFICGFDSKYNIRLQALKFSDTFSFYDLKETEIPVEKLPVSRALNGETVTCFKCRVLRKDTGNSWYGLVSAIPVFDGSKVINVVLSIKDISDLVLKDSKLAKAVQSENLSNESAKQLRLALMVSNQGLYDFNIPAGKADVNPEYETMLGYAPGELQVTLNWWKNSIHPEDREQAWSIMNDCIYGKIQNYKMEFRMRTKSGSWKWVLCQGRNIEYDKDSKPLRMLGTHIDITERKRAQEALEKTSYILSEGQKIAHLGTFEYIIENRTTDWSEEEYRIFGLDPSGPSPPYDVMLAKNIYHDDAFMLDMTFTKAVQNSSVFDFEHRLVRPDGTIRWVHSRANPYFDNNGKLIRYVGVTLDITDRKQMEKKLLEHSRFIESIVNMTPDILYIYDIVDKKNIYVNTSIEKILGYTKEEIQSMGNLMLTKLMHPEDYLGYQKIIIPKYSLAKDNELIIHEYRIRNKSGEWRWLVSNEMVYLRQADGAPRQIFGLVHDITTRKAVENALRESEYFFKESQRAANIGSYKLDFISGYWKSSEVLDQIFGIGPDYIRSIKGWLEIVHPDDRKMMDKYLREEIFPKRHPFSKEYRIIRKSDKIVRWVIGSGQITIDSKGSLTTILGTVQDITERKEAEEKIQKERNKLINIAATVPGVICSFRINPDGSSQMLYSSSAMLDASGFRSEDMAKDMSVLFTLIHPDDVESVNKTLDESKLNLSLWRKEFRYRHPIKGEVWIEINAMPQREENGSTVWHGFVTDITERKQAEENLQKALKEKEVLLQELYHRTKNNMQVISAYLEMQAITTYDEKLHIILNEMENRIRSMALVHEKLYKSKDLTNINLCDYLQDLTKLIFNSFSGVSDRVSLDFNVEVVFVTMDIAIPVGLIVTELLTNSLKYAFPDQRSGKILLHMKKHDHGELELDISDNGIGFKDAFDLNQKNSIGIPTVHSIITKQLRGSVGLNTTGGFSWKIVFRTDLYEKRV